ncbi:MAG: AMP-dependent synthetase/ligase [Candidatus Puniceispirillaceae bacterium]
MSPVITQPPRETTLVSLFFARAAIGEQAPFIFERYAKSWHSKSWQDISDEVLICAAALRARGISSGMRVAIISENRHEWVVSDLAIMLIGAISVPLFTTQTSADYSYLLRQSGARAAICSTAKIAYQVEPAAQAAPNCLFMVIMNPGKIFHPSLQLATLTWQELLKEGREAPPVLHEEADKLSETDVACIIYNSGDSEAPKGVMLTHKSIMANLLGVHERFQSLSLARERVLSFLPLSHAYEHSVGLYYPIHILAEIYYLPRPELLSTAMLEVRPTLMTAVPRMFDLLKERLEAVFRQKGPLSAMLFARATRTPSDKASYSPLRLLTWAERLIINQTIAIPVRNRLGGSLKAFISGGAALNPKVSHFFNALNVTLLQGYGLTEASPVVSVTPPDNIKQGSVGLPLKGAEVKLSKDGELCIKGDLVMAGYWDDPAATRQTIKKGWLHTGDLADIDSDGHITILGVKRDMIVNSGGENISPLRVEMVLHAQSAIQQAIIFGDSRPYLVALLTASSDMHIIANTKDDPMSWLQDTLQDAIRTANANLSPTERIRHFIMTDEPFSQDNKLLSATGDYRRKAIIALYRNRLEALYLKKK